MSKDTATKQTTKTPKDDKKNTTQQPNDNKKVHGPYYQDVAVECICGHKFTISTTIPGPIKVETCYVCHPAYNKNKDIKKVAKGRMEKFLEKQKRMQQLQK